MVSEELKIGTDRRLQPAWHCAPGPGNGGSMIDLRDLRRCAQIFEAMKRMSARLEEIAERNMYDDRLSIIFGSLRDYAWDCRMRAENRDDMMEAVRDILDSLRHEPTEAFSQPHDRRAA